MSNVEVKKFYFNKLIYVKKKTIYQKVFSKNFIFRVQKMIIFLKEINDCSQMLTIKKI